MSRFLLIISLIMLAACGAEEGTKGAETGEACAQSNVLDQCPPNSEGTLEANAESNCSSEGSVSVEADGTTMEGSGSGAVSQVCVGSGSCRVVCKLIEPCTYGVMSISPTDGIICQAAPCGNGVCDPGENPENCNADCGGAVCTDGASRCSGNAIERCNQMGVWETTPCPDNQICNEEDNAASCTEGALDCAPICDTLFTTCVENSGICPEGATINRASYDTYCARRCREYPTRFEEYLMTPDDCQTAVTSRVLRDNRTANLDFCDGERPPACGDGNQDEGEACDDGNQVDGDGCAANCTLETRCGDGNQDEGEACDDGNQLDGDGCAADCTLESSCDEACQTLCATTCSALWENCMNPVGRPADATECPGAALQAHTETCTELCRDEAQHAQFVDISEDPTRCVRAHNNGLFTCDPSECGNGTCEYGETRAGNGQQCQADCR